MSTKIFRRLLIFSLLVIIAGGCKESQQVESRRELLIYCGVTMVRPVQEIARMIEQQNNCIVKISKQGSAALLNSIKANRTGDLYLPTCDSFIQTGIREGLISDAVTVGYDRLALIVRKGNPLQITPDVRNLADHRYRVVLGSAESGSAGRETEQLLTRLNLYRQAVDNALYLTPDADGMIRAVKDNNADLALNWYATTRWEENRPFMEGLPLDDAIAPPCKLMLGLLTFSSSPELARRFMELATSPTGQEIFASYQFLGK